MTLHYCNRCITPSTHPLVQIHNSGICSACVQEEKSRQIDWRARSAEFVRTIASEKKARFSKSHYDCLVPVSGGKDSFWQVRTCLEHGLRPLTVTWKTPAQTKIGRQNLDALINLGVDNIEIKMNPETERTFLRKTFLETGSTAIPKHMAIFAAAMRTAVSYQIPLIFWGENPEIEYGNLAVSKNGVEADDRWLKIYGGTQNTSINYWVSSDLPRESLTLYERPDLKTCINLGIHFCFLGYFFKWDPLENYESARKLGFQSSDNPEKCGYYQFADVDCDFIDIHHYLKWFKFGYTRIFDDLSYEIRIGRLSRTEALEILSERSHGIPKRSILKFCKFIAINEEQFWKTVEKFRNPKIWEQKNQHWVIPNFLISEWKHWENLPHSEREVLHAQTTGS